ncbi:amidohydrolase family protein [Neorhodopirellula pilleata]|uniref:Amidohydrolase n=1 Tax=Neorhodopirellula pilleata TaxID=2714738 RepID=A0A5C6A6X8_9BACT|nr:amidohydrolase family protein [Neorhodopirellula pilleata]TWT95150.1 Amidohydrolase [Neorhodopirellula pilleata]
MLIDAHHHLWKFDPVQYGWIDDTKAVLQRDFLAPQLREIATENSIDGFVSVQARQSIQETRDLLAIAEREPLIQGVVGWLPLAGPGLAEAIEEFAGRAKLVGLRHVVQDEPDDRFLDGAEFNEGVASLAARNLVYDLLVYPHQLPAAIDFADRHQDVRMVLDHIAKPVVSTQRFDETWKRDFTELARRDNVTCKFSGVATEVRDPSWDIETVRPYWDVAMEVFGPERLMFGSDWPVCLLATEYSRWLATVRELASTLSDQEQAAVFAGNAIREYRLNSPRTRGGN